jgi:hypothetical protein
MALVAPVEGWLRIIHGLSATNIPIHAALRLRRMASVKR